MAEVHHPIIAPPNNTPYLVAIVAMVGLTLACIVITLVFYHGPDTMQIIGMIVGASAPTTLALLAFLKSQETHLSVNSRLDEFKRAIEESSRAKGEKEGIAIGKQQAEEKAGEITQILADMSEEESRVTLK